MADAVLEHGQHLLPVEAPRLKSGTVLKAEDWNWLGRFRPGKPVGLLVFHATEQRAESVLNGGDDVLCGSLTAENLGAEEGLAQPKTIRNRAGRHPDFRAGTNKFFMPDVLLQIVAGQAPGEAKFAAHGLADFHAVDGANGGRDDVLDQQAVVLMAMVDGSDQVKLFLVDRANQALYPLGSDAFKVRRDHGAGFCPQQVRSGHDGAPGAAPAVNSAVGGCDPVNRAQRAGGKQGAKILDGCVPDRFRGSVIGPAVRIDQNDALTGEILDQPQLNGIDHLFDGAAIVECWHSDEDVHLADSRELADELIREKSFLGQCCSFSRVLGRDPVSPDLPGLRIGAAGTSKIDTAPESKGMEALRCAEMDCLQTIQWGYNPANAGD